MKKYLSMLILLSVVFYYTGCSVGGGGGDDEPVIDIPGNWTVMVWLDGDNNLESYALNDLNEIELGLYNALKRNSSIENNIKIIVQVDRCPGELTDVSSDWTDTRRYLIKPDSVIRDAVIRSERLDSSSPLGEINMGDASELKDFISYCKTSYPSDNYALILWNHGGGVRGAERLNFIDADYSNTSKAVCQDETDNDWLYIGEITDVLTASEDVDFLGFDACLMGMAEVAYEYRPDNGDFSAEYMAASPATEQGDGWEYDALFSCFTGGVEDGITAPAEFFSKAVVAEYKRAFSYYSSETMSAFDLSKISDVKSKLDDLAASISDTSYKNTVESIRGNAPSPNTMEYFDQTSVYDWVNWPHFDLYDFADKVSSSGSLPDEARSAADALKSAVSSCVLKSWGGRSYSGFTSGENGLGVFFTDGDALVDSDPDYYLYEKQWWYTSSNPSQGLYGRLDFCDFYSNGTVETWKELLEKWYDPYNNYNSDKY